MTCSPCGRRRACCASFPRQGRSAHRHLERQLAEGPPREGHLVARARAARRAADAGDEARRRATCRCSRSAPRATSSRTTARGAGTASPSPAAAASTTSSPTSASRCAPAQDRRRGRRRAAGRGADDRGRLRRRARRVRSTRRTAASSARRSTRPSSRGSSGSRRGWRGRRSPAEPLVLGGDFNVAPDGHRRVGPARVPRRHPRLAAGARGVRAPRAGGVSSTPTALRHPEPGRYTWWDYRAGNFHKNFGMRIDHLLVTAPLAQRTVAAEIDREARKGKPIPSDHAPLVIDLDAPGARSTPAGLPPKAASPPGGRADAEAAHRAHAREARHRAAGRRGLAVRAEVGRLPRHRLQGRRRGVHAEPRPEAARPLFPRAVGHAAGEPARALRGRRGDRHRLRPRPRLRRCCSCGCTRRRRGWRSSPRRLRPRSWPSTCWP